MLTLGFVGSDPNPSSSLSLRRCCALGFDQRPHRIERNQAKPAFPVSEFELDPILQSQSRLVLAGEVAVIERISRNSRDKWSGVGWALNGAPWLGWAMDLVALSSSSLLDRRYDQHELAMRHNPSGIAHPDSDKVTKTFWNPGGWLADDESRKWELLFVGQPGNSQGISF
jgi:hypothetical protein